MLSEHLPLVIPFLRKLRKLHGGAEFGGDCKDEWGFVRWKRGAKELLFHNRQRSVQSIVSQASVKSWSGEGYRRTGSTLGAGRVWGKKVTCKKPGLNREVWRNGRPTSHLPCCALGQPWPRGPLNSSELQDGAGCNYGTQIPSIARGYWALCCVKSHNKHLVWPLARTVPLPLAIHTLIVNTWPPMWWGFPKGLKSHLCLLAWIALAWGLPPETSCPKSWTSLHETNQLLLGHPSPWTTNTNPPSHRRLWQQASCVSIQPDPCCIFYFSEPYFPLPQRII